MTAMTAAAKRRTHWPLARERIGAERHRAPPLRNCITRLLDRRGDSLEHRTDRVREAGLRAASEAEADRVGAGLGHHERARVSGPDERSGRLDLVLEHRGPGRVSDRDRDVDGLN